MNGKAFPVAAVIVGAGAGKRFGGPKAAAILPDGRRFVDVIASTAREAGCDPVVAVLPKDVPAPAGVRTVVNPDPEAEQIVSARMGLALLANTSVVGALLWPVDHPFVTFESVLAILDAAKRTGAPIVLPRNATRRGHPVFFHREAWRELMTVPAGGARSVVRADAARVVEVDVNDVGVLRNQNEPLA